MSAQAEIPEILDKHNLRKTPIRIEVLEMFINNMHALSHSDIEHVLKDKFDRVTIYRTLYAFEERGLIHKVPDEGGIQKYALCHEQCNEHHHHDEHVHFVCKECGHTYCLDTVVVPQVQLPADYTVESVSFSIHGVCRLCNQT